jgi:hypothetical protein
MALLSQILPGTGRGTARAARGGGGLRRSATSRPPSVSRRWRAVCHLPASGRI